MSKHTICLLNDSFPPIIDGVSNAVLNYARIIEQRHGHSMVVTPEMPGADDSVYEFPVVRYPSIDTRKLVGYVTGYPFSPDSAYRIREENAALLHVHCPIMSCFLARQLHESMDLPLVLTWHTKYDIDIANAISSKHLRESAVNALIRNVSACNEVWTVSSGAGENLRSLGFEGEYFVMPNGVDLPHEEASEDMVRSVASGYDLPRNVPTFLFIGRLMWYKGLRIILDALARLHHEGCDFRMVFVGGGGDEAEVRAYAAELGLERKVIFTGIISDRRQLRAWYTAADLFLFPSTFDTNGLVVRESAACSTASVIIRNSCASEGVTDGRNGFLIDENSDSLAAKLRELISAPELVKTVGLNAGSEIYISWEDSVAKAYERYCIVIDRYKSGYYKKRLPYDYDFFRAQGELMETLGDIHAAGRNILRDAETIQEGIDQSIRSARNKALTDVITAGYEAKQELKAIREEAQETIDSARQDLLDFLDRYL